MSFISLTNHAKSRSLQRYAIPSDKLLELAEKSVTVGYSYNDAPTKSIGEFIKRKTRAGYVSYVYFGYVFVFKETTSCLLLITTFRLPNRFVSDLCGNKRMKFRK